MAALGDRGWSARAVVVTTAGLPRKLSRSVMAKFFPAHDMALVAIIAALKIFFAAAASDAGRINRSPKGTDCFRCLDMRTVACQDLTGSGNEAAAHLLENDRVTIMFCSFDATSLIPRLYGRGRTVLPADAEWKVLPARFDARPGQQIVVLDIESVQTSCGFAVPRYEFQSQRPAQVKRIERKGPAGMEQ